MNLSGTLEHLQEIKAPGSFFIETLGSKKANLPKICPDQMSSLEVVEGNWGEVGCILLGHYLLGEAMSVLSLLLRLSLFSIFFPRDGNVLISKETLEAVDEKNQSITFKFLGGDLMNFYKTLKVTCQATSKGEKNFMKSTYEYEKLNSDVPAPEQLKEFVAEIIKKIDEHYLNSGAEEQ